MSDKVEYKISEMGTRGIAYHKTAIMALCHVVPMICENQSFWRSFSQGVQANSETFRRLNVLAFVSSNCVFITRFVTNTSIYHRDYPG